VIVRSVVEADLESVARVHWLSSNTAYERNDDFERRLRQTRDAFQLDYVRMLVAELDGEIVGLANVGTDELYALYVHPDHWGSAAAQALIDEAHVLLAESCDEASLTVLTANPRARRFYERNGWQLTDTLVEPHFGGEPTEVCRYCKDFSS
jgi:RimJ/RimL family protein N-acetyltransferase